MKVIPFAKPCLDEQEEQAVLKVLRSGWLTSAGEVTAFEQEFAEYVGADHALALNSATAGLHLSLKAAGIQKGDYVATTPYTFAATAEVIRYFDAHPLFCDIDDSCNISPQQLEKAVSGNDKVKAIIPVHFAGLPCDMQHICEIAEHYELTTIEDAAHCFPSKTKAGFAGNLGDLGVYSFYATKTITTAEGGMVVTNNSNFAEKIGTLRLHGIDRPVFDRYSNVKSSWYYEIVDAGFKYNMPDLAAAMGRVQLRKAENFLNRRKEIAAVYNEAFQERDYLILPPDGTAHAWHLYTIKLDTEKINISRDDFIQKLKERGIGASVHFIPLHIMPYYKNLYGFKPEDFPVSMRTFQNTISIPIYPDLDHEDLQYIISTLLDIGDSSYQNRS